MHLKLVEISVKIFLVSTFMYMYLYVVPGITSYESCVSTTECNQAALKVIAMSPKNHKTPSTIFHYSTEPKASLFATVSKMRSLWS